MVMIIIITWLFTLITTTITSAKKPLTTQSPTSPPTTSISIISLGDWGYSPSFETNGVRNAIVAEITRKNSNVQFGFLLGDNFYDYGINNQTEMSQRIDQYKILNMPQPNFFWYVTLGNHDYYGNASAQVQYPDSRWFLPKPY